MAARYRGLPANALEYSSAMDKGGSVAVVCGDVLPAPQGSCLLVPFLAVREVEMAGRLFLK